MAKLRKKKRGKKPHPKAAKLQAGLPTAEQVARGDGTAGILGAIASKLAHGAPKPGARPRGAQLLNSFAAGGIQSGARIVGGVVLGRIHATPGFPVTLEADVIVGEGARLSAEVGSTIQAKEAYLGDRFVRDLEIASDHVGGITSTQVSSPTEAIISAVGDVPNKDTNHERVGTLIAGHLGNLHLVVPEKPGECGARLRDGRPDPQVDVFLKDLSDNLARDVRLQVFFLPVAAKQLGEHGAAIDLVVNEQIVQDAVAHKGEFAGKDKIDLVVSCPVPIRPAMRKAFLGAAAEHRFGTGGYARLWLVDADGWIGALAEAQTQL